MISDTHGGAETMTVRNESERLSREIMKTEKDTERKEMSFKA